MVANAKQLARFREVCGFRENGQLPITFPQVMSTALQIKLMLEPEFPFNPIGVVHLRNQISQTRVLTEDEALDFNVATSPMRTTPTGYEVDFVNSVSVAGEQVWQAIATVLIRRKLGTSKPAKREHQKGREYAHVETWGIPGNRGQTLREERLATSILSTSILQLPKCWAFADTSPTVCGARAAALRTCGTITGINLCR